MHQFHGKAPTSHPQKEMWGVKKWLSGDLIADQTANSATLEWVLCNRGLPVLNFGATGNGEKEKKTAP